MKPRTRIGILTGGGDCPGLNAVIRAVVKTAVNVHGMETIGFLDGFRGLVFDHTIPLTYDAVSNIITAGGTILGTSNKENFFGVKRGRSQTVPRSKDQTHRALATFRKHRLAGIICIGGDGTLTVADRLHRNGIPQVGVPKTIDNDVRCTEQTFGFDSAAAVAALAVDRLHSTAVSHQRVMVLEVMGRHAGWIALHAGLASGGDIILIPEIPFRWEHICRVVRKRSQTGRRFSIVIVAEGAAPEGGRAVYFDAGSKSRRGRLGGMGMLAAAEIQRRTGVESRVTVLGYLQRGGGPTPFDRVLATRYGHAAAGLAARGRYGQMVSVNAGQIGSVDLAEVAGVPRSIPADSPLLATARSVGTSFGDGKTADW